MLATLVAALLAATSAFAGAVQIRDTANLLSPQDEAQLRGSASGHPFDVRIVTTGEHADREGFNRYVGAQLSNPNMVVVGIDPTSRRTSVHFGNGTRVARDQFARIENAGDASFRQGNWRGGVEAILNGASTAVGTAPAAPTAMMPGMTNQMPNPAPVGGGPFDNRVGHPAVQRGFPGGGLMLLGLLALGGLGIAMMLRRRRAAMAGGMPGGFNAPMNQGPGNYPPGNYPPGNYPQGNYPQQGNFGRGGMGPLGGGALGAGLGGILGYGLGRASAEHERHEGNATNAPVGGGPTTGGDTSSYDAGGSTSGWEDTGGGDGGGGNSGGGDGGGGNDGGGSDW